ncbi:MAG TPA: squalene/phytoene synthase family protein [Gaiellaceae bacterium]|nr:squalene/phytoene synthase family protein [Gaiellaceae bacterium]
MTVEQAYEECRRVARASGSSFYAGMRLLPPERRRALFAVYALARRIDDVADGPFLPEEKLGALARLRLELVSIRESREPVFVAVADAAERFPIPLSAFSDLLDGAEADVRGVHHATFADLERYCRRVAGSIGRLALGVFGTADRARAEPLADDLGVALQLGNILRDLGDDLRHGRSYLPDDDYARFGCAVRGSTIDGDAELLVAFAAERALEWLEHGLELVPLLDRRSATCVLAMTTSYRAVIEAIAAEPLLALGSHVSLAPWRKRLLVARALVGAVA